MSGLTSKLILGPRIGQGHFGEVLLGKDPVHGDVAVKVLRVQPGESPSEWHARKAELLKEGQRLSRADHRNVVRVYHLVEAEADDEIYLVMRLCRNGSYQSAFEAGPLQLKTVLKAATDVALGLQALHARQMLHRDIKPGNLLNDNGVTMLGDFGLVTDEIVLGYASQAGYLDHLAPEIFAGKGTSVRSDIWALGMTIYRLLHGAEWYSRLLPITPSIIAAGGFAASLPWLPHVSESWRRVIRSMMHDDPSRRLQSASQVLAALSRLSSDPNWACRVTKNQVRWESRGKKRRVTVTWDIHSPRKHEWSAVSEPIGAGIRRTLAKSNGPTDSRKARAALKKFFSA
jgi:serine/threonine-protein kinase